MEQAAATTPTSAPQTPAMPVETTPPVAVAPAAPTEAPTPIAIANAAAAAPTLSTEAKAPAVAANDKTVTKDELTKAEDHVAKYLGRELDKNPATKHFLTDLQLNLVPVIANGEHADLVLHFKGPQAAADPLAFERAALAVLKTHPLLAAVVTRESHKPEAHSGDGHGCDMGIKLPKITEHEFQTLIDQLAKTPVESLAPLVAAAASEHGAKPEHATHASGAAVTPPAHGAHGAKPEHAAAPSTLVANDNESPQLDGKLVTQEVAATR